MTGLYGDPAPSCLDGPTGCAGPVEYRESLSGTGTPIPRCDEHWEQAIETQREIRERYPDTAGAPAWYRGDDYAGEHWDDDY